MIRVQRIDYPDAHQETYEKYCAFFKEKFPRVDVVASNKYKEKSVECSKESHGKPCAQLWQRLVVAFDGTVGPCCEMNRLESLGKFPEKELFDMWDSDYLKVLRGLHWTGNQNKCEGCRKCMVTRV